MKKLLLSLLGVMAVSVCFARTETMTIAVNNTTGSHNNPNGPKGVMNLWTANNADPKLLMQGKDANFSNAQVACYVRYPQAANQNQWYFYCDTTSTGATNFRIEFLLSTNSQNWVVKNFEFKSKFHKTTHGTCTITLPDNTNISVSDEMQTISYTRQEGDTHMYIHVVGSDVADRVQFNDIQVVLEREIDEQWKEHELEAVKAIMLKSKLYTEEEADNFLSTAINIDEITTEGGVNTAAMNAFITDIPNKLMGRKFIMSNSTVGVVGKVHGGLSFDNNGQNQSFQTVTKPETIWTVEDGGADGFYLKHLVSGKYLHSNTLSANEKSHYAIEYFQNAAQRDTTVNEIFQIKDTDYYKTATNKVQTLIKGNPGSLSYWGPWTAGMGWGFELLDSESEAAWVAEARTTTDDYVEGNEPGQYSFTDDFKTALNALDEAEVNYPALYTVLHKLGINIFDLHSHAGNALIAIKSYNGKYMLKEGGFGDSKDVFVMENDGDHAYLSSMDGNYLTNHETEGALFVFSGDDYSQNNPTDIYFLDGGIVGGYHIGFINGWPSNNHATLCNSDNEFGQFSRESFTHEFDATENCSFYVEYVKELSAGQAGQFTLWRTPVAVTITSGEAYVVSVVNANFSTAAATAETTYGAGTSFLLDGEVEFSVINADATAATAAGLGHHAAKTHTMSVGASYLTIHPNQSADQPAETPAQVRRREGETAKSILLAVETPQEEKTVNLAAHDLMVEVSGSQADPKVSMIRTNLGDSIDFNDTSVGIAEIAVSNASEEIFDLQGRKVANAVRGLFIVNGKKIVR